MKGIEERGVECESEITLSSHAFPLFPKMLVKSQSAFPRLLNAVLHFNNCALWKQKPCFHFSSMKMFAVGLERKRRADLNASSSCLSYVQ